MPCQLELEGRVATFEVVLRDPELEGQVLEDKARLEKEAAAALSQLVYEQFGERMALGRVSIERGSILILAPLVTVGKVIIDYGALMVGLHELSRLIPKRLRAIFATPAQAPSLAAAHDVWTPAKVILGPAVLAGAHARQTRGWPDLTIAMSAFGGAFLVIVGLLLGHFL